MARGGKVASSSRCRLPSGRAVDRAQASGLEVRCCSTGGVGLQARLAADVSNLDPGDDPVCRPAIVDASERATAAGALMSRARGAGEFDVAKRTVLEGLTATRLVRERLGPPELSILSDEFLDGIAHKEQPNLQMGMLRKLLSDEIRTVQRINLVQARRFSEQLDDASTVTPTGR